LKTWYVAFSKGRITAMRVAEDRSEAIALACDMLDRRIEVTGVGPMLEIGQREIDPATIRQIWRDCARDNRASSRQPIVEEAVRPSLMNKILLAGHVATTSRD
jgi:hypothetical protein